jgi:hypothetical protein
MTGLRNLPGAKAALVAFVLTVLLGIGATSAAGLWQQSASTSMTVAWTDTVLTCADNVSTNGKTAALTPSPTASMTITAALANANGTYGVEHMVGTFNGTANITPDTVGVKEALNGGAGNVRITATFAGPPAFTRQIVVNFAGSGKATCVA